MKSLTNPTFLGITTIILSVIGIASSATQSSNTSIVDIEHFLAGIFGLIPGILLLLKSNKGLLLAKIWSVIQIPYFVSQSEAGVNFAIAFHNITLYISTTNQKYTILNPTKLSQEYTTYGINLVGVILLILFLRAKLSTKISYTTSKK